MLGETISHYRILEKLGQGGMGEVYLAEDTRLVRKVALKFLAPDLAQSRESLARFRNEARAAAELSHPNIATIHDFDEVDGSPFLVLEYLQGQTLKERVAQGPLPIDEVLRIGSALASGLVEAHSHGIVHRDIKSANVMLTKKGDVKILDFGLAHLADATQLTRPGTTLGTIAYMSPQQARGESADERSDIWALGVVLYESLTGRLPFGGEPASIMEQIQHAEAQPPTALRTGVSLGLESLILRCLEKDADLRPQHADEVLALLNSVGRETSRVPSPSASPLDTGARSTGMRIVGWLVLISALAIVATWFTFRQNEDRPARTDDGEPPRLAVLPFETIGTPAVSHFEDGLVEELATQLGAVRRLRVLGIESTRSYRNSETEPLEIGRELDATYLLTGSVRWASEASDETQVRVTSRLVRVSDAEQVWASSFNRVMSNLFLVQADISGRVAEALNLTLLANEQAALTAPLTQNAEAYAFYLKGLEAVRRDTPDIAELFLRATLHDPEFAAAWARLCIARSRSVWFADGQSTVEAAREAADRAREAAPGSFEAALAAAYYHYWALHDLPTAEQFFSTALALRPSSGTALAGRAAVRRRMGQWPDALEDFETARSLDPRDLPHLTWTMTTSLFMRDFSRARELATLSITLQPDSPGGYWFLVWAELASGDIDAAIVALERGVYRIGLEPFLSGDLDIFGSELRTLAPHLAREYPELGELMRTSAVPPRAILYEALGNEDAARVLDESRYGALVQDSGRDPPWAPGWRDSDLGHVCARLGKTSEALVFARRLESRAAEVSDAMHQFQMFESAASIYALAGEYEPALELIEQLLARPSGISIGWLEIDPFWEPLRGHARYQELVRQFEHRS